MPKFNVGTLFHYSFSDRDSKGTVNCCVIVNELLLWTFIEICLNVSPTDGAGSYTNIKSVTFLTGQTKVILMYYYHHTILLYNIIVIVDINIVVFQKSTNTIFLFFSVLPWFLWTIWFYLQLKICLDLYHPKFPLFFSVELLHILLE